MRFLQSLVASERSTHRLRNAAKRWANFWRDESMSHNRHQTPKELAFCAKELSLYFPDPPASTIEFGCGNGELYEHFREHVADYCGVDFSPAMLQRFRQRFNTVNLVKGDITKPLPVAHTFDFAFSHTVCQFLTPAMLRMHLRHAADVVQPGGRYLIANIPDAELRAHYYAGGLRSSRRAGRSLMIRFILQSLHRQRLDSIGCWYSRAEFGSIARQAGFECDTHSSATLEYRFHAALTRRCHLRVTASSQHHSTRSQVVRRAA